MAVGESTTREESRALRFWSKVNKTDTCWLWTCGVNNKGYGRFQYFNRYERAGKGRDLYAHRVAWMLTNGSIPPGLEVIHECDTPVCVNPSHLRLGTHAENMADCKQKGRTSRRSFSKAKLTEDSVRAIRNDPRKHHIIAADYGVKRMAVFKIKHRKSWKHVA